ncbi:TIGR02452 family protein [Streptomyces tateyamensis]|uniref:TIGR02452 family protein n=1 Tax=Streptomyces tateyamensis TaxID=565073 RepID=A0A2V4NJZ6_9ACTN|nr:TIGR02452 family protein [Streptomyces tateyamensis]PYC71009.1 TIGR02452 family protein [Streptomyces tateyamensis]
MSNRFSALATENERIAETGHYLSATGARVEIAAALAAARAGTVSYSPDFVPSPTGAFAGVAEVTDEDSMSAARRITESAPGPAHLAVLNFASARNPGGGYLRGAKAQEEDLCRSALLYQCLLQAPDYYEAHRASADLHYSHRVIFSPQVPVIRDSRRDLLGEPYAVSFLTSPAPNAGQLELRSPGRAVDLAATLAERARRVLGVAAQHGVRELVLGAWGCGVFRNDPAEVAAAFAAAMSTHGAPFTRITFAVLDRAAGTPNLAAFQAEFGS